MNRLPPIDLHAHFEVDISERDLLELGSLVFAATRSLDEAESALLRSDLWTIWGVGCHPGVVESQKSFDHARFAELITRTPYVSEVGLDGKSRVPMNAQRANFDGILGVLQGSPRITSIHSFAATEAVLECLGARPIQGAVLHWWLGDAIQTQRAVELGCYFSINASMLRRSKLFELLPLDRLLTETDHPFGDRLAGRGRRPGSVAGVELEIASKHGLEGEDVRRLLWQNLAELVRLTRSGMLLPRGVRVLAAAT